jgi:hypothetical protein
MTYWLLPHAADAKGKGGRSLHAIADATRAQVQPGSFLVYDGVEWGCKHAPAVNHQVGCRDVQTGFNRNNAESTNHNQKSWSRHLWTTVTGRKRHDEHIFFDTVGCGLATGLVV